MYRIITSVICSVVPAGVDDSVVTVTALDANHCPGSLMFLYVMQYVISSHCSTNRNGSRYLHSGDFRHNDRHVSM